MNQFDASQIKQQVDTLVSKEVDRKEFLKHVGIGVLAMTGVVGVLRALNVVGRPENTSVSHGYGTSTYGGKK